MDEVYGKVCNTAWYGMVRVIFTGLTGYWYRIGCQYRISTGLVASNVQLPGSTDQDWYRGQYY